MREVTFFWKRTNVSHLVSGPITEVVQSMHFISYARRVPKDIRCIFKVHFQPGMGPKDINRIGFMELIEVLMDAENEGDGTILLARLNHPAANLSARINGTSAVPGACFLDGEGITYTIQGPPISLRLFSGFLRMIAKPDRTSARSVKFAVNEENGALSRKQLKLAKFAYDRGYFDTPKRIRIAELAQELGLARATISEHMARIESTIMDDLFSSFSEIYVPPETLRELLEVVAEDHEESKNKDKDAYHAVIDQIRNSVKEELSRMEIVEENQDDVQAYVEESMRAHKENISYMDDLTASKNTGINQI
jgi:predicted DNA binding protein